MPQWVLVQGVHVGGPGTRPLRRVAHTLHPQPPPPGSGQEARNKRTHPNPAPTFRMSSIIIIPDFIYYYYSGFYSLLLFRILYSDIFIKKMFLIWGGDRPGLASPPSQSH